MAKEKETKMEVITGDHKDLKISSVYDHVKINGSGTTKNKKKRVVVPKTK